MANKQPQRRRTTSSTTQGFKRVSQQQMNNIRNSAATTQAVGRNVAAQQNAQQRPMPQAAQPTMVFDQPAVAGSVSPVAYSKTGSKRKERNASKKAAQVAQSSNPYVASAYKTKKKAPLALKILGAAVLVLALIGGGLAAFAYMYASNIDKNLSEGIDQSTLDILGENQIAPGDPFYMLIVGTDGSEARKETYGDTFRSDSMILARIDPVQKKVTLISLERDTYVNIEGYGPNKLNASAAYGGAPLVISTVQELAGVPISHYAQVDFDGFESAIDALGGVEVDVPIDIDDDRAGGQLSAGLQTLNGEQALILCRSRHAYDAYGSGDYYRMANQRLVLGAMVKKVLASDAVTQAEVVNAMSKYITTDLSVQDVLDLAAMFKGMDTSTDIYSAMTPTTSAYINGTWYEYLNVEEWQKMMARVDAGLPPYEDDAQNLNEGGVIDQNKAYLGKDPNMAVDTSGAQTTTTTPTPETEQTYDSSYYSGTDSGYYYEDPNTYYEDPNTYYEDPNAYYEDPSYYETPEEPPAEVDTGGGEYVDPGPVDSGGTGGTGGGDVPVEDGGDTGGGEALTEGGQ
ncbi:Biofilm regulatory protein A precursor [Slackia heliotrinireducens]|nr:LCP family protein [Slackia heliotrinireducens]VEG98700.1 Biofilm regulatory protein A precursor [Slackia heliotrinireducens]